MTPVPTTVRERLLELANGDTALAKECAAEMHIPILRFARSSPARVEDLKRLDRTVDRAIYFNERGEGLTSKWIQNAQEVLSKYEVMEAMAVARPGESIGIWGAVPPPDAIKPSITPTIKHLAHRNPRERLARNDAVTAVIFAHSLATGRMPTLSDSAANETLKSIAFVESAYADIIPQGFGIARDKKAVRACIDRAKKVLQRRGDPFA